MFGRKESATCATTSKLLAMPMMAISFMRIFFLVFGVLLSMLVNM